MQHAWVPAGLVLFLSPIAAAQDEVYQLLPKSIPDNGSFGRALVVDDGLVVAGNASAGPEYAGRVQVFDLTTGVHRRALKLTDPIKGSFFGDEIASQDGWTLISSRHAFEPNDSKGAVHLVDPLTGAVLRTFTAPDAGTQPSQHFGAGLAIQGDLAVIGAPNDETKGIHGGAAYLLDISKGAFLAKLVGADVRAHSHFGRVVTMDGGLAVISAAGDNHGFGAAYVFDTATGQELFKLRGSQSHRQCWFGHPLSAEAGMVLIGSPGEDLGRTADAGAAYLFDLQTGSELHRFTSPDAYRRQNFGHEVHLTEDLILIGAPGDMNSYDTLGQVYVFDVHTYGLLEILTPSDNAEGGFFGFTIDGEGCWLAIAAVGADDLGLGTGKVYLFALPSVDPQSICDANRNSTGHSAALTGIGSQCVDANHLRLQAIGMPPNQPGSFLVSDTPDFVPFAGGGQGNLCLAAPIGRYREPPFVSDDSGSAELKIDLTSLPTGGAVLPGDTWYFQAWFRDVDPLPTVNMTDGIALAFR